MKKFEVVERLLGKRVQALPAKVSSEGYAPTNIALCKYWGKRNGELNLPVTSSLSIALPDKGSRTRLTVCDERDEAVVNGKSMPADSSFIKRLSQFLDLFRPNKNWNLRADITMNIPVAAGLASSASGFASVVLALDDLFDWQLPKSKLSILARLGSGSASRSFWNGFVEWHVGSAVDGMDSFAEPLPYSWSQFVIGILTFSQKEKPISSRDAMKCTVDTSVLYESWPKQVARDLNILKEALETKDFDLLGKTAEANALAMHATMLSSWPPISFTLPETLAAMQKIWQLRDAGLSLYFTQDAGPNLKLLFQEKDISLVKQHFPEMDVIRVF